MTPSYRLIDLGAACVGVASPLADFQTQLDFIYGQHGKTEAGHFADVRVALLPERNLRPWRAQVSLWSEALRPFDPYPRHSALPLFEWGTNWLLAQRLNAHLLLHAGVVARDDQALILPASPGSGKSTLTCALHLAGWRYLSDEFGVVDTQTGHLLPLVKAAALKNRSIEVIGEHPEARLGPIFPGTRKGDVAHFAPTADSVSQRHCPATPRMVVFPRYSAGSGLRCSAISRAEAFMRLGLNSFNYRSLGPVGFKTVGALAQRTRAYELVYEDLAQAIAQIETLFRTLP